MAKVQDWGLEGARKGLAGLKGACQQKPGDRELGLVLCDLGHLRFSLSLIILWAKGLISPGKTPFGQQVPAVNLLALWKTGGQTALSWDAGRTLDKS